MPILREVPIALLVLSCLGYAQKPLNTGAITGHVTCADTNTPARLARIVIRPVPAPKGAGAAAASRPVEARSVQALLDGSFAIPNVAPGTYLVLASMPGYITPLSVLGVGNEDLLEPSDELRKRILERIPTVNVESGAASINISLERGAAISGTILFDDGSPAPEVGVQVLQRKDDKWVPVHTGAGDGMWSGNGNTDDRGNYRIVGLPPLAEVVVKAQLEVRNQTLTFGKGSLSTSGGPNFSLAFYTGSVLRPNQAKPFRLTIGEERPGEDITLPLGKLHKLHGALLAKKDGHVLNQGSVSLLFADDRTPLGSAFIGKDDESFNFAFVPEGDYVLQVNSAADVQYQEVPNAPGSVPPFHVKSETLHEYGTAEIPIHIDGERTDITIDVPDKAPPAKTVAQQ